MELSPITLRIKTLMDQRGMNRADLSRATGIPYHRLNPWFIREAAKPNAEDIDKIAAYFGVQVGHLINGEPIEEPSAKSWIVSVYDRLPQKEREQLEGFVRFLDKQRDSQDNGQD